MTNFTTDLPTLVTLSAGALLQQKPVEMVLGAGWERPANFPLPIKRRAADQPQSYRPLAILEWVDAELRGENKGRAMAGRSAAKVIDRVDNAPQPHPGFYITADSTAIRRVELRAILPDDFDLPE
jgi:hypothetical protein